MSSFFANWVLLRSRESLTESLELGPLGLLPLNMDTGGWKSSDLEFL